METPRVTVSAEDLRELRNRFKDMQSRAQIALKDRNEKIASLEDQVATLQGKLNKRSEQFETAREHIEDIKVNLDMGQREVMLSLNGERVSVSEALSTADEMFRTELKLADGKLKESQEQIDSLISQLRQKEKKSKEMDEKAKLIRLKLADPDVGLSPADNEMELVAYVTQRVRDHQEMQKTKNNAVEQAKAETEKTQLIVRLKDQEIETLQRKLEASDNERRGLLLSVENVMKAMRAQMENVREELGMEAPVYDEDVEKKKAPVSVFDELRDLWRRVIAKRTNLEESLNDKIEGLRKDLDTEKQRYAELLESLGVQKRLLRNEKEMHAVVAGRVEAAETQASKSTQHLLEIVQQVLASREQLDKLKMQIKEAQEKLQGAEVRFSMQASERSALLAASSVSTAADATEIVAPKKKSGTGVIPDDELDDLFAQTESVISGIGTKAEQQREAMAANLSREGLLRGQLELSETTNAVKSATIKTLEERDMLAYESLDSVLKLCGYKGEAVVESPFGHITVPTTGVAPYVLHRFPDREQKPAVVDATSATSRVSYLRLYNDVSVIAGNLYAAGFKKGDICALYVPNCLEYAAVLLAVFQLGGTIAPIPPYRDTKEVQYQLSDSGTSIVITTPSLLPRLLEAASGTKVKAAYVITNEELPEISEEETKTSVQIMVFSDLLKLSARGMPPPLPAEAESAVDPAKDIAILAYPSSSVSGAGDSPILRSGVSLTHRNVIASLRMIEVAKLFVDDDVVLSAHSFSHVYGLVTTLLGALCTGATIVALPRIAGIEPFLKIAQELGVTSAHITPPLVEAIARFPMTRKMYALPKLRHVISTSAPISSDTVRGCAKKLRTHMGLVYTIAELCGFATLPDLGDDTDGMAGILPPSMEVKIIDVKSGAEKLARGQNGQICMRGPNLMAGYFGLPEDTSLAIDQDNWLKTGDYGYLDTGNRVVVLSRMDELIRSSGGIAVPGDIEKRAMQHPDIVDCAAIGVPHPKKGEVARLFAVVSRDSLQAQEVIEFVNVGLPDEAQIQGVEFVHGIPKTPSGKIRRTELATLVKEKMKIDFVSPFPDIVVPATNIADYVLRRAEDLGDKLALSDGETGRGLSYAQLSGAVGLVAASLQHRGFEAGDCMAILCPNVPEVAVAVLAVFSLGGSITVANSGALDRQIVGEFELAGASWILSDVKSVPKVEAAKKRLSIQEVFVFGQNVEGATPFTELLTGPGAAGGIYDKPSIDPDNSVALYAFTSGITGAKRCAALSHRNIVASIAQQDGLTLITPDDVIVAAMPFFHVYGLVSVVLSGLATGATMVTKKSIDVSQDDFSEQFLQMLADHHVTKVHVFPPIIAALADAPADLKIDLDDLQTVVSVAAPYDAAAAKKFSSRFGVSVVQQYGHVETCGLTHVVLKRHLSQAPGSVGVLLPNMLARVVDIESGDQLSQNEFGELWFKGPQIIKEYVVAPGKTPPAAKEMIGFVGEDGWFRTGDFGMVNSDGFFFVKERVVDLINTSGGIVLPEEVEGVLKSHPAVSEACLFGIAMEQEGLEEPKAWVVLKEGEGEDLTSVDLIDYVSTRVAAYKVPEYVEIVPRLIQSRSGKLMRLQTMKSDRRAMKEKERKAEEARKAAEAAAVPPAVSHVSLECGDYHTSPITVEYQYSGGEEGSTKFKWTRVVGESTTLLADSTSKTSYQPNADDFVDDVVMISVEVTPVRVDGAVGISEIASVPVPSMDPVLTSFVENAVKKGEAEFAFVDPESGLERHMEVSKKHLRMPKDKVGSKIKVDVGEVKVKLDAKDATLFELQVSGKDSMVIGGQCASAEERDRLALVTRHFAAARAKK